MSKKQEQEYKNFKKLLHLEYLNEIRHVYSHTALSKTLNAIFGNKFTILACKAWINYWRFGYGYFSMPIFFSATSFKYQIYITHTLFSFDYHTLMVNHCIVLAPTPPYNRCHLTTSHLRTVWKTAPCHTKQRMSLQLL